MYHKIEKNPLPTPRLPQIAKILKEDVEYFIPTSSCYIIRNKTVTSCGTLVFNAISEKEKELEQEVIRLVTENEGYKRENALLRELLNKNNNS